MRMGFYDVMGTLYSKPGMRLGGCSTVSFLEATNDLEAQRPGVRGEIIAEAHYCLLLYTTAIPEIAFVAIVNQTNSLLYAMLGFIFALFLGILAFKVLGTHPSLANFARVWRAWDETITLVMVNSFPY
jgi:hypothetical protein